MSQDPHPTELQLRDAILNRWRGLGYRGSIEVTNLASTAAGAVVSEMPARAQVRASALRDAAALARTKAEPDAEKVAIWLDGLAREAEAGW